MELQPTTANKRSQFAPAPSSDAVEQLDYVRSIFIFRSWRAIEGLGGEKAAPRGGPKAHFLYSAHYIIEYGRVRC